MTAPFGAWGWGRRRPDIPEGDRLKYMVQLHFSASNNAAEYEALLYDMRMGITLGVHSLYAYGDSAPVVGQVMKGMDCKEAKMEAYCQELHKLEGRLEGFELDHVMRADNEAADALANMASRWDQVPPGVFLEHLTEPSIKRGPPEPHPGDPLPMAAGLPRIDDPVVMHIADEGIIPVVAPPPEWAWPYIDYHNEGTLPVSEEEARRLFRRAKSFILIDEELHRKARPGF